MAICAYVRTACGRIAWAGGLDGGTVCWRRPEEGKPFSLPNSRIVIHQPLMSGLAGRPILILPPARLRMRERINDILVHHTGQLGKRIQDDTERDYSMSGDQGKEYGIIDDVIRKRA
jgi:ATP-dependent Clp protease protease subunit